MVELLKSQILTRLKAGDYRPQRPRGLAKELHLEGDEHYATFRAALRDLMDAGRVMLGASGSIVLPTSHASKDEFVGSYRHNKRGFGFVVPNDPTGHEDLYISEGQNMGAMTGDVVRAKIVSRGERDGKAMHSGKITEIITRGQKRFVGSLQKVGKDWSVLPDGNMLITAIRTPDAASRHIKPGTKVVVELTEYPTDDQPPVGVITEVLGAAGEKDVDLQTVIVQYNLPGDFPDAVKAQARQAIDRFDPDVERENRLDLSDQIICTIDPDDAKDYDDAISLRKLPNGNWQLGVHIADVSYFVPAGTPLDEEARKRGNSCYFPGKVIPMLPEILSNGVCSLMEAVPRLCKSAFIEYGRDARPVGTKFANTMIQSRKRLRYKEAQALIDRANVIPHPEGDKTRDDYDADVLALLDDMNTLSRQLQARRKEQGQLSLDLPSVDLVLDDEGKVVDAVPEDESFTHTLIEMFMVEANEAVARLLDGVGVPFLRRTHPTPDMPDSEKLRHFVQVTGFKLPKDLDRKAIQQLLASVHGRPEAFAINMAVLKTLTRAEYSPKPLGHYALASEHYAHFTSPIRRYADLTIHRLLDAYFAAREAPGANKRGRGSKLVLEDVPTFEELTELGRQISFTERQAEAAERELKQVKVLELLKDRVGDEFDGVVTGITQFGVFVQINRWLVEGLNRYQQLLDDWWDVDAKSGFVRGQRTGKKICLGDTCKVIVARVDVPRRELDLSIKQVTARGQTPARPGGTSDRGRPAAKKHPAGRGKIEHRGGATARNHRSKRRGR